MDEQEQIEQAETHRKRVESEERGGWRDVTIRRDEPNQFGNGTACPLMAGGDCMRRRCAFAVPSVDHNVDKYVDDDGTVTQHNTMQTTWTCHATDARPDVDGEIVEKYREWKAKPSERKLAEMWG